MKEDQVKTMRPGSSVIWPVAEVETVIIACLVRTSVTDVPKKKAAIRWFTTSTVAMRRPWWTVAELQFSVVVFFWSSWFSKAPGPRPRQTGVVRRREEGQHPVKGPELGWHNRPVMTLLAVICGWKSTGNMIMRPVIGWDKLEISQ